MNVAEIQAVMSATQAGELTFPEVVGRLLAVGVESYLVDFATGRESFYATDGTTHTESMDLARAPVHEIFSGESIVSGIRSAESDAIRYPEFVQRARNAGVTAYWAFLTGKKVIYFGRRGEQHIEEFPRTQH